MEPCPARFAHTSSRVFLRRLASGNLPFVRVPRDAVRFAVVDEPEPPDERQVKAYSLDVCHAGDYTISGRRLVGDFVHCTTLTAVLW